MTSIAIAKKKEYVKKDQREHVLLRPDMYVGSNKSRKTTEFVCVKNSEGNFQIIKKEIDVSPAILRIFIEILSNATDNVERSRVAGIPCSYIKVDINKETGEITLENDGDVIPIEMNNEEKMYNHTLIFGNLLTGSNYDDEEERLISGRNGVGGKAANIFSSKFTVKGLDPNQKKTFEQTWTENMKNASVPIIEKTKLTKGYTSVSYIADFKQFGLKGYNDDIISIYLKYVIDVAMLSKVKVYFNDELIPVNNLQTYSKLYESVSDENLLIKHENSEVLITPSSPSEFQVVSFVNGIYTKLGGQHVDSWSEAIFRPLVDKFNKKGQPTLNIKDIKQFFRIFVVSYVVNPEFESQNKNRLENPKVNVSFKTADLNKILKWSVMEDIEDIIKSKEILTLKKSEKKKKGYVKIDGLDPANKAGTKESHLCSLILCEGLSAKTYAVAGIQKGINGVSGRDYYGVLSLLGKILNVRNAKMDSIAKNKVITDLIQALNLQHGTDYTDENNFKNLSYGKVILLTDADCFTDDTALLIRKQNSTSVVQIDSLFEDDKEISTQLVENIEVWSDSKWVKIKAIRKKQTTKKILTINTYSGLVRCTEDHTFLLENGDEIKAKDIKVGDKLLRNRRLNYIPELKSDMSHVDIKNVMQELQCYKASSYTNKKDMLENINKELKYCSQYIDSNKDEFFDISKEEAWFWGLFFADGSCGIYTFPIDREKQTKINTEKSRKRWIQWVEKHTNNVNKYKLLLEDLKINNKKYGHISNKLKGSQKRLEKATENCHRESKEQNSDLMRTGYCFSISNSDYEKLAKSLHIIKNIYNYDWKIIEVTVHDRQRAYRLILNGGKRMEDFISLMRSRFYTSNKLKKVPDEILNNRKEVQQSFLDGYYAGDGFRWLLENKNSEGFDILGQVGAQGLCFIAERLGYSYNIKEKNGKLNVFTINISKRYRRFYPGEVKNIYETDYKDRYVYDIETETGRINAGIGNMVQRQCDGLHISSLIMNLFHYLFPSILERKEPYLVSMETPIVRVFRKEGDLLFYDENKFKEFSKNQTSKIKCKYYKGLGTTKSEDVKDTFGERMVEYIKDGDCDNSFNKVFHNKFSDQRKEWLEKYDPTSFSTVESDKFSSMNITDFLNNEMIKFSHDDCKRSIPNLFDGLKQSQRKVLYAMKKRNLSYNKASLKVAQLAGYVAEVSNYHHGEGNLFQTITKMANEFAGSNNIPLLYRDGQFGCLDPDTIVLLWNGFKKKAKDVLIDDLLMGDDGEPRKILKLVDGVDDMYEIKNPHGSNNYIVNSEHILTLFISGHKSIYWKESKNSWCVEYYDEKSNIVKRECFKVCNGEDTYEKKLDFVKANEIRQKFKDDKSNTILKLSKEYNVSKSTIERIVNNRSWKYDCYLGHNIKFEKYYTKETAYEAIVNFTNKLPDNIFDIKLKDYLKMTKHSQLKCMGIINNVPILWEHKEVPIDPYIFGLWLGDGDHNGHGFSSMDEEVVKEFVIWGNDNGIDIIHNTNGKDHENYHYLFIRKNGKENRKNTPVGSVSHNKTNCVGCKTSKTEHPACDWVLENFVDLDIKCIGANCNGIIRNDLNPFKELLKKNNLFKNKHIPDSYIKNDEQTRLKLLAGFIDTDGYVSKISSSYVINISQDMKTHGHLIDSLQYISNSLGFRTSIYISKPKQNKNGTTSSQKNLRISGENLFKIPTKILRKKIPYYIGDRNKYGYSINVRKLGKGKFNGWSVDKNERFLLGDFTITHNSRSNNGSDAANARYIFTKMEPLTPLIFREEDDVLLERVYDDGDEVEPKFYIPIIPMVLVNGASGIGSGWSSSIPSYNPLDVINCIEIWLKRDGKIIEREGDNIVSYLPEITPWYRDFKGKIEKTKEKNDTTYITHGVIDKDKNKATITEIPIGMSTDKFKEMCEDWMVDKKIKNFQNYSTPNGIYFVITESEDGFSCNLKNMKLHSYLYTSNMVLFNQKEQLKKYSIEEIINDFCVVRYDFYKKRKAYLISIIKKDLRHLFNKARFVEEVISKKLHIMNVEEAIIVDNLEKTGYDKENEKVNEDEESGSSGGYNYLLKMQVRTFTSNKVKLLRSEIEEKNNRLKNLESTTEKQLWLNDLDEFKKEYVKWLKIMEPTSVNIKQQQKKKKKE